jgi:hypothetical protein
MPIDWDSVPTRRSNNLPKCQLRTLAASAPPPAEAAPANPSVWRGGEPRDFRQPIDPDAYKRTLRAINRERDRYGLEPVAALQTIRPIGDPARRAPMAGGKDPGHIIRDPDRLLAVMRNDPKTFAPETPEAPVESRKARVHRRRRPRLMKGGK